MTHKKVSPNFYIHEFVPGQIYRSYGVNSQWFVRPEVVKLAEFYRKWFDAPVTINDWYWGGRFSERGYRVPDTTTGAKYSQHKFGAAFDCNVKGLSANEVRNEILNNQFHFMAAGLTTLEHPAYAPTWVHSDIRNTGNKDILIVKPMTVSTLSDRVAEEHYKWVDNEYELLKLHFF